MQSSRLLLRLALLALVSVQCYAFDSNRTHHPSNINQLVSEPINQQAFNELMECVANLKQKYNAYVDQNGFIVFFPVERRTIDLKDLDAGMLDCIRKTNDRINTMLESAEYPQQEHADPVSSAYLTFEHALSSGVKGPPKEKTKAKRHHSKRYSAYLGVFASDYANCDSSDYNTYYIATC